MKRLAYGAVWLGLMVPVGARANFSGYEAGNASTGNVQPLTMAEDVFRPSGLGEVEMQDELLQITLHIESADVEVNYLWHQPLIERYLCEVFTSKRPKSSHAPAF